MQQQLSSKKMEVDQLRIEARIERKRYVRILVSILFLSL